MTNEPKISVIIPVYNASAYLSKSLGSVIAQTLEAIEIICINDGSTDDSLAILNDYAEKDSRIRIIDQPNHGVGYARNVGIRAASGEFVAFLDPDDFLGSDTVYELLYKKAKEHGVNICGGSFWEVRNDGADITKDFYGSDAKFTMPREALADYRDYQFDYGFYRFLYKRTFLMDKDLFFPEYVRFQDPPFFVKAMIKAEKFYAVPDCTYCYRVNPNGLKLTERKICDIIRGVRDNLIMSSEANLPELHILSLQRLSQFYTLWLTTSGYDDLNTEICHQLNELLKVVRTEWLSDTALQLLHMNIYHYLADVQNQKNQLTEEINRLNNEIYHLRSSYSFRIGRVITVIPRAVKRKIKNIF